VVNKALTIVGAQVRRLTSRIELKLDPHLPEVEGYPQKIEQVVANLLINASFAIPVKETGSIEITTGFVERLGAVLLTIEDNGCGMEHRVLEQIFEPFFTTRRDQGGTGLGLSVSYNLVKDHRGTIAVLSKPGVGSRFTVFLPVSENVDLDLRPSILVLDDNQDFLQKLTAGLGGLMIMPYEARIRPEKVLKYVEDHPEVDVILLKIMFPEKDAWEFYEAIRNRFPLIEIFLYATNRRFVSSGPKGARGRRTVFLTPLETPKLINAIQSTPRQRL